MKKINFLYIGSLLIALVFIASGCTKTCDIRLKNDTKGEIKILTKGADPSDEKAHTLQPGEDFKVGQCTDCTDINEEELEPSAMLVSLGMDELELKDKKEIVKFLNDLKSEGCVVKIFE
jgi:hypothetical protein